MILYTLYATYAKDDINNCNNNTVIIKEFRTRARMHEHDFISIKNKCRLLFACGISITFPFSMPSGIVVETD
jgi:hypothetical protein